MAWDQYKNVIYYQRTKLSGSDENDDLTFYSNYIVVVISKVYKIFESRKLFLFLINHL
jgi:hypothetical protein